MDAAAHRNMLLGLAAILGLTLSLGLMAVLSATPPVQAAGPAWPLARDAAEPGDAATHPAVRPSAVETVTTFIISNEAPGHLVDDLIARGHGNDTLLQVLAHLRAQSGGAIPAAFYNQVAAAPPGSEMFTARLNSYAGLVGGIEIGADGTVSIPEVEGQAYAGVPGFTSTSSLDVRFTFTVTQDRERYIYTHSNDYGGGRIRNYYAFGIAWRGKQVVFLPLVRR